MAATAGDWRDDCVKPVKDTRVQTEVLLAQMARLKITILI